MVPSTPRYLELVADGSRWIKVDELSVTMMEQGGLGMPTVTPDSGTSCNWSHGTG